MIEFIKRYWHVVLGFVLGAVLVQLVELSYTKDNTNTCNCTDTSTIEQELQTCKQRLQKLQSETNSTLNKQHLINCYVDWVMSHSSRISEKQAKRYIRLVFDNTDQPLLVLSIIARESNFNPTAVSRSGAIGLGQILATNGQLETLKKNKIIQDKRDLFDPETNIIATNFILQQKLKYAKGDLKKALTYYVGGNNKKYVNDVLLYLGELYLITKQCEN